jgi:hypothetical protein
MWYKMAQIDPKNIQPLDTGKYRQKIPTNGALEVQLMGGTFNMGPNDPPKLIQVKDDNGAMKNIIVVHGTPDDMLTFPDSTGKLTAGTIDQFDEWRKTKGWQGYPWVSCYGGQIVGSHNADTLINATGNLYAGTYKDQEGNTVLQFTERKF